MASLSLFQATEGRELTIPFPAGASVHLFDDGEYNLHLLRAVSAMAEHLTDPDRALRARLDRHVENLSTAVESLRGVGAQSIASSIGPDLVAAVENAILRRQANSSHKGRQAEDDIQAQLQAAGMQVTRLGAGNGKRATCDLVATFPDNGVAVGLEIKRYDTPMTACVFDKFEDDVRSDAMGCEAYAFVSATGTANQPALRKRPTAKLIGGKLVVYFKGDPTDIVGVVRTIAHVADLMNTIGDQVMDCDFRIVAELEEALNKRQALYSMFKSLQKNLRQSADQLDALEKEAHTMLDDCQRAVTRLVTQNTEETGHVGKRPKM